MNIEEKISRIVDSIYDYAMHGTGGKQLADYKNELTALLQQEREKAVREFAKWLDLDKEAVYKMPHFIQEWAEEYLSSDEKEEGGGK